MVAMFSPLSSPPAPAPTASCRSSWRLLLLCSQPVAPMSPKSGLCSHQGFTGPSRIPLPPPVQLQVLWDTPNLISPQGHWICFSFCLDYSSPQTFMGLSLAILQVCAQMWPHQHGFLWETSQKMPPSPGLTTPLSDSLSDFSKTFLKGPGQVFSPIWALHRIFQLLM